MNPANNDFTAKNPEAVALNAQKEAESLCRESKEEIAKRNLFGRRDKLAFLSALIFSCGSLIIHGNSVSVTVSTQNKLLEKAVCALFEEFTGRPSTVTYKGKTSEIIAENAFNMLCRCKVLDSSDGVSVYGGIAKEFFSEESAAAYVRGAYLGAGNLNCKKYHLEFSFGAKSIATDFKELLKGLGIESKATVRGERAVVYVKDSDLICDCLALMGAHKSVLKLNAVIAARQMTERLNRQRNCDLKNIDRQVEAGINQCAFIRELDFKKLSVPLKEIAEARLNNPESSYEELGVMLGISKSGAKNRLARLRKIYENSLKNQQTNNSTP